MTKSPQPHVPLELFYSYSHKDSRLRDTLETHLRLLQHQGVISSWHDRRIGAGDEWARVIDARMKTADIILLLVSANFIASQYCYGEEMRLALRRHRARKAPKARVIPVMLRECDLTGVPFAKLNWLPDGEKPVADWRPRDKAFTNIACGIRRAAEELLAERRAHEAEAGGATESAPAASSVVGASATAALTGRPPTPVVGFVARRDEQGRDIVALLREELAPAKRRLVAVWGPGGAGKTTLADEFLRSTEKTFRGRVAWVSSTNRADFGLATLLDEIATQLRQPGLRRLGPELKAERVAALVAARPTLVVLDNLETVAEDEQERCLDFLARSACPALITTRSYIDRDDVYNVPLAAMSVEEAREFLKRLVERTRKPDNFERLDRDELILRCEANPLLLQWAVRQIDLAKRPLAVLAELVQGETDAAERVFARSYNLPQLGDDGRAALLALSLFATHAAREALAEVAGFGADLRRLEKAVGRLSALWLVETTEGNERLFLRGLTRGLALARMESEGRADEFRRRYVAHFVRHAEAHTGWTAHHFDELEAEKDNLLGAVDAAFGARDWKGVIRLRYRLDGFLILRGYWDEAVRSGHLAESAARADKSEWNVAYFQTCVAEIWLERGEYDKAGGVYRNALAIFRKLKSDENIARCLHYYGLVKQAKGDRRGALRLFRESLKVSRKLEDKSGIASATSQIGIVLMEEGRIAESRAQHEASLAIRRKMKDQQGIAVDLHQLGILAETEDDLKDARRLYVDALKINRRLGNKTGLATNLDQMGQLAEKEGDRAEAARLFREALRIFEKLGSTETEKTRGNLARVEGGV